MGCLKEEMQLLNYEYSLQSLGVIEGLGCVIGLLGRNGLAATLGKHCP